MAIGIPLFADLSDEALTDTVKRLARDERQATAQLVASLAEFDARRLYLGAGCASLFAYCTRVLHLAEHAAYNRIEAARAARRCPIVLERLAEGAVTLTAVRLLAPHLTAGNAEALLDAARHHRKRDLELLVAGLRPQPPVPASVRKLPAPSTPASPLPSTATTPAGATLFVEAESSRADEGLTNAPPSPAVPPCPAPPPERPAIVQPLAPDRYRIQFTASLALVDKLRRAQDLLRHTIPTGDPALVFDRALTVLVAQLEKATFAATDRPRRAQPPAHRSRHIAASVRRAVWARDQGQCTFVGTEGRCCERGFLQFHHLEPYALGGKATVEQIALRCAAHNRYEGELAFGRCGPPPVRMRESTRVPRDRPGSSCP